MTRLDGDRSDARAGMDLRSLDAPGHRGDARGRRRDARRRGRASLIALMVLGSGVCSSRVALGHRAPGGRSVVAQVEPCEVVLLVSWTPSSSDEASALLADAARGAPGRPAAAPGPGDRLRGLYAARALAPLQLRADDRPLAPRTVEVKLLRDPPGSSRIAAVALVAYDVPRGARTLEIANTDSHRTRFSWVDRSQGRFQSRGNPTGRWSSGVASILLQSRTGDSWPSCPDAPS